nr:MAG TPA: hypothetical protein [Caudoviricetes sp.]
MSSARLELHLEHSPLMQILELVSCPLSQSRSMTHTTQTRFLLMLLVLVVFTATAPQYNQRHIILIYGKESNNYSIRFQIYK